MHPINFIFFQIPIFSYLCQSKWQMVWYLQSGKPSPPFSLWAINLFRLILALFPSHRKCFIKLSNCLKNAITILIILILPQRVSLSFSHSSRFVVNLCSSGCKLSAIISSMLRDSFIPKYFIPLETHLNLNFSKHELERGG